MKSVSKKQEAIIKQQLRVGIKCQLEKFLATFLIKLESIEHHPLNASQSLNIVSLVSQ